MRVLLGAPTEHPVAWKISKVENAAPLGIQKLTLYQGFFDTKRDYIEKDENGKIIGMYADWYDSQVEPVDQPRVGVPQPNIYGEISSTNGKIKVGGTYKTLTLSLFNKDNEDITNNYSSTVFEWTCSVESNDMTDVVTWLDTTTPFNQIKLKFPLDKSYLTKILKVKCKVTKENEVIEASTDFELY